MIIDITAEMMVAVAAYGRAAGLDTQECYHLFYLLRMENDGLIQREELLYVLERLSNKILKERATNTS